MATFNSTQLGNLFGSTPRAVRELLYSALQLRELEELYARARAASHAILSRAVLDLLNIRVDVPVQDKERFPHAGAVVVVANHPFGLLDGLVLDAVLQELRPDVKIWPIRSCGESKSCAIAVFRWTYLALARIFGRFGRRCRC